MTCECDIQQQQQRRQQEHEEEALLTRATRRHPVMTGLHRLGCAIVHPAFVRYLPRADGALYSGETCSGLARHALAALCSLPQR